MIDDLLKRLVGPDKDDRYEAGFELHRLGRDAVNAAIELAHSEDGLAREMACYVLGRVLDDGVEHQDIVYPIYYMDGLPVLLRLLEADPEPSVRGSAALALSFLSSVEALPTIINLTYSTILNLRFEAVLALSNYSPEFWKLPLVQPLKPGAVLALLQRLHDQNAEVRSWSVLALSYVAPFDTRVRRAITRMVDDPDCEVREEVQDYMKMLAEEKAEAESRHRRNSRVNAFEN